MIKIHQQNEFSRFIHLPSLKFWSFRINSKTVCYPNKQHQQKLILNIIFIRGKQKALLQDAKIQYESLQPSFAIILILSHPLILFLLNSRFIIQIV